MNLQGYSLKTAGLETSLQILFWKCLERKGCSKILEKIFGKNCPFFFNVTSQQSRISDFNKIRLQEKCLL